MRKRCAGIAPVILIALIAVGSIAILLSYAMSGDKEKAVAQRDALDKCIGKVKEDIEFAKWRVLRIAKIAGAKGDTPEEVDLTELVTSVEAEQKVLVERKKDVPFPTLERLILANLENAFAAASAYQRAVRESAIADASVTEVDKRLSIAENTARQTKTSLTDFKNNLSKQLADETEKFRVRIDALAEAEKTYSDQLTTTKNRYEKQIRQISSEIMESERKLQTLLTKETVVKPAVEVLGTLFKVDPQARFAFVDTGAGKRLVRGMKFKIFRKGIKDLPVWVALAEVKEIFDLYSLLSIVKLYNRGDMPVAGDHITNPFHDFQKPRIVILLGDITTRYYAYDREEVIRRMEDLGIKVTTALDDKVDFIIAGKNYENLPLYNEAIRFRIPILAADDILEFIGD
jgi:hypothetical protein